MPKIFDAPCPISLEEMAKGGCRLRAAAAQTLLFWLANWPGASGVRGALSTELKARCEGLVSVRMDRRAVRS